MQMDSLIKKLSEKTDHRSPLPKPKQDEAASTSASQTSHMDPDSDWKKEQGK